MLRIYFWLCSGIPPGRAQRTTQGAKIESRLAATQVYPLSYLSTAQSMTVLPSTLCLQLPQIKTNRKIFFWWHFSPVFSIKKTGCLFLTHSFSLDGLFLVKKKSNKGPHWNCWNLCAFCVTVRRFLCELCAGGPSVCSADSVWYLSCQGQVLQQEENFRHF